jgi:hypothetical protein
VEDSKTVAEEEAMRGGAGMRATAGAAAASTASAVAKPARSTLTA